MKDIRDEKYQQQMELIASWGFDVQKASASVLSFAEFCVQAARLRTGEVVSLLGLATPSDIESYLAQKPEGVPTLEYLTQMVPSISQETTRILAVVNRVPFLSALTGLEPHPDSAEYRLQSRLEELNAALLTGLGAQYVLCFSEFSSLVAFRQRGRSQRENDPLETYIQAGMTLALAPVQHLMPVIGKGKQFNSAGLVSSSQDNYWSSSLAKTESERLLGRLLDNAASLGVTDMSIEPNRNGSSYVYYRQYGDITRPNGVSNLTVNQTSEIVRFLITKSRAGDGARLRAPADGQIAYKTPNGEVFIRASFIPADRGGQDTDMISVSLRLLAKTSKNIRLASLGLQNGVMESAKEALMRSQGLIVLAGPTGSGKSTTIAGMVGEHVELFGVSKKRLSLEDPVERYLEGITQFSVEGQYGKVVKHVLRHDPDVIWIGEIRDRASASACVRASTSGHLVLSTVHANSSLTAFKAIGNYLVGVSNDESAACSVFDLAESLSLVVAQRLVKALCPNCKRTGFLSDDEAKLLKRYVSYEGRGADVTKYLGALRSSGVSRRSEAGCEACAFTGYKGELPVNEVLECGREVKNILGESDLKIDYKALDQYRETTLFESVFSRVVAQEVGFESMLI